MTHICGLIPHRKSPALCNHPFVGSSRWILGIASLVCACGLAENGLMDDDGGTNDVGSPDVKQDVVVLGDGGIGDATLTDVVVIDSPPDAPNVDAAALCAATCPTAGGVCLSDGTCHFDCSGVKPCGNIKCPACKSDRMEQLISTISARTSRKS